MAATTTYVCGAKLTNGGAAPASIGKHTLVQMKGPGVFISAVVSRQETSDLTGLTSVTLELDNNKVVSLTFEAAANTALTQPNPYGILLTKNKPFSTMTIGFSVPLRFESLLTLKVEVKDVPMAQIVANVLHGDG
jgi:hypothetical protein